MSYQTPNKPPSTGVPADPPAPPPSSPSSPTGSSNGRPPSSGRSPSAARRHGRREHQRAAVHQPTFLERHRNLIVIVAALAGVALLSVFVFTSASQAAYACSTVWTPTPTASPAAGATPALGYVQPDMGRGHLAVGDKVSYTYCAPASGSHYNKPGAAGPIPARVYGPNDSVLPEGWLHNLEHGGIVILYTGANSGATPEGQAQLRALYDAFPAGPVCGTPKGQTAPIMARFDQMSTPFQAIVWGRVLPLDTLDQTKIIAFWEQWGERTNPEKQCAAPSATPTGPATPASASPAVSVAPSPS